jgi:transcriptional regulator with XRE-family HTH domain
MTAEVLGVPAEPAQPAERWIPDDTRFGARLALIRQRMEWGNVKEAALACGVPVQSWRSWERDNIQPRGYEGICRRIAAATGVDLDWLMRGRPGGSPEKVGDDDRPTRNVSRPVDNRPSAGPGRGSPAGLRRPSRVPRSGEGRRA